MFIERTGIAHFAWIVKHVVERVFSIGPKVLLTHEEEENARASSCSELVPIDTPFPPPHKIPNFLLHVMDPNHVPPHEVGLQLCQMIVATGDVELVKKMYEIIYIEKADATKSV